MANTSKSSTSSSPIRVLVVGGGFGGVKTALLLSRSSRFKIQLVSDRDHFAYYPQLYHTATGGSKLESWIPLSELFKDNSRVEVLISRVDKLDPEAKVVGCEDGRKLKYDQLVLAMGNVTNYFGIAGMADFSFGMKTLDEARELKHHLHENLTVMKHPDHHYVVVGAGPTGVEMAGALVTYIHKICQCHGIKNPSYQIDLIEAAPRILPRSSDAYAGNVAKRLKRLGVHVMTGKTVKAASASELTMDGSSLATQTVIWTAGVANNPFYATHASLFNINPKNHKVTVNQYLEAHHDVYVIGDNADTQYSGLALTAINDAIYLAANLERAAKGEAPKPYVAKAPMTVIPVGEGWAAFNFKTLNLYGRLGWLLRRAGDFVAYHDIAKLVPSIKYWLADSVIDNECPTCDLPHKPAAKL